MKHGTGSGRGRHRGYRSPETRRWLKLEADLDRIFKPNDPRRPKKTKKPKLRPAPDCPSWLRPEEYAELIALREKLS